MDLIMFFNISSMKPFHIYDNCHKFYGLVMWACGLYLSERHYFLNLLNESKLAKKASFYSNVHPIALTKFDPQLYQSIARGLQYLSFNKPKLGFAKYMQNPMELHEVVVKNILCYSKQTIHYTLLIQPTTDP